MRVFTLREKMAEVATLLAYVEGVETILEVKSIEQFLAANADMTKGAIKLAEIYQEKESDLRDMSLIVMEDFSDQSQPEPVIYYVDISEMEALATTLTQQLKDRLQLRDEGCTYHPCLLNCYRLVPGWRL